MGFGVAGTYVGVSAQVADAKIINSKLGLDIAVGEAKNIIFVSPDAVGQGTFTLLQVSSRLLGLTYYNSAGIANGDNFTFKIYMPAGTYRFTLIYDQGVDRAIFKVYIDGVEVQTVDAYSGSPTNNNVLSTSNIVVAANGVKSIQFKAVGKNAGSSNYVIGGAGLCINRTA